MSHDWTTADECLWLNTIGQAHEQTRTLAASDLLARYLEGARRRRDWGALDRQKVLRHAVQRHAWLMAARKAVA